MSSKGRDNTISPIRAKSRLKKRRRQQKETNNEGNADGVICSLQNLSHASSKQTIRHCPDGAAVGRKENSMNGLPSASKRLTVGKGLGNASSLLHQQQSTQPSRHCPGVTGEHLHELSSWQVYNDDDPIPNNNDCDTKNASQRLAFIEKLDQSTLISAIPRILGIDLARHDTLSSTFQSKLERAFAYNAKGGNCPRDKDNQQYRVESRNAIYHSLVGRIDPHSKSCPVDNNMMGEHASIAFPSCSAKSNLDEANNTHKNDSIKRYDPFQHLNLRRRTEFGMIVPLSWYQFPVSSTTSKNKPVSNEGGELTNASEGGQSAINDVIEDRQLAQKVSSTEDLPAADCQGEEAETSPEYKMAEHTHAQKHPSHEQVNTENSVQSIQHRAAIQQIHFQGKFKILSHKGATIREVFDIDNSNHVLGKLHMGDIRYYLEKKTLLPPPICLDGSDDEEEDSDDECVAVVRYKIVLEPSDCVGGESIEQFAERLPTGQMVGWISDRSRLADDPFLILKVL